MLSFNGSASASMSLVQSTVMDMNLFTINTQNRSPLDTPGGSLSKLDLKAPGKARREYDKGHQLLMKKDFSGAVEHLTAATSIYPSFVSAHNSLGSAYLSLGQQEQARAEFAQAIALDDHLPTSYFNLGCAQLALKQYSAAEESIKKASNIAPLDLTVLTALTYGQLMNQDFAGAVTTAHRVHERKHEGASLVHLYAAAAWGAQQKYPEAQLELNTLLKEDPKSPAAEQARQIIAQFKDQASHPPDPNAGLKVTITDVAAESPSGPVQLPEHVRKLMQESNENKQLAEAEADSACPNCVGPANQSLLSDVAAPTGPFSKTPSHRADSGFVVHASTDEVAVFFAATDHGKSVTTLTGNDVVISDASRPPAFITGFRNESELPLRLGLVIDTSDSVTTRFKFEQVAATNFVQKVVTNKSDLAFVVGFSNSVLLVQDFTGDQTLVSHAIDQLVPAGGTALWDAVAFAADKLANRAESQPIARVLVVISDGEDNSSSVTAKQAMAQAQRGEVTIYTVSTRELTDSESSPVGEHALQTLADLTGGAAFTPGSAKRLNGSLDELQQVLRSRYLISYKPALFQRDGKYRPIEITAEKAGRKLHVYARKGYFASAGAPAENNF